MSNAKVMIIDDQAVVRRALRDVLERAGFEDVAEADSLADAIERVRTVNPDIVILDASLPDSPGITSLTTIIDIMPDARVIYLGSDPDALYADQALRAGAAQYIPKEHADTELAPVALQLSRSSLRSVA